jgi:hypothetical protein
LLLCGFLPRLVGLTLLERGVIAANRQSEGTKGHVRRALQNHDSSLLLR